MDTVIAGLWYAGMVARLVCLGVLIQRKLFLSYAGLSGLLLLGLARSGWLAFVLSTGGDIAYQEIWLRTQPLMVAVTAIAVAEAFWAQARHYRVGFFGFVLMALFGSISLLACLAGGLGSDGWLSGPAMLMGRNYSALCLGFLLLSQRFFQRFRRIVVRRNVQWVVWGLELYLGSEALTSAVWYAFDNYWINAAAQITTTVVPLVCYAIWTLKIVPAGERFLTPPTMSLEEFERGLKATEARVKGLDELRRAVWANRPALHIE